MIINNDWHRNYDGNHDTKILFGGKFITANFYFLM